MKPYLLLAIAFAGCSTVVNYPSGRVAARIQSNVRDFAFTGGGITVTAKSIDNATPTYVGLAGTTDIAATVAGGAFAIGAPGANGATRAAVHMTQHVTPRFQRAAPRPVPINPP